MSAKTICYGALALTLFAALGCAGTASSNAASTKAPPAKKGVVNKGVVNKGVTSKGAANRRVANPAAQHCLKNGGKLRSVAGPGGKSAECYFSNGSFCDEWAHFRGECQPGKRWRFSCDAGASFVVEYMPKDKLTLSLRQRPGKHPTGKPAQETQIFMHQIRSGSGIRYVGEGYLFLSKGKQARLDKGKKPYLENCRVS